MNQNVRDNRYQIGLTIFASLFILFQCKTDSKLETKTNNQIPELDWSIEIVSEGHGFTEGPTLASDGNIFFTDMDNNHILKFNPNLNSTNIWYDQSNSTNGLRIHNNMLYACQAADGAVVKYDLKQGSTSKSIVASTFIGDRLGSPNDLAIIGDNLYFSEFWLDSYINKTEREREIHKNRVYKLSLSNNTLDSLHFNFDLPNGIALTPDKEFLFITDWLSNKVYKAEVQKEGLGQIKLFTDLQKHGLGGPDGLAVDKDGFVFLALYGEHNSLLVIDPTGNPIGYLPTGTLTSNCVFAADGKTLYITANKKLMKVIVPEINKWNNK